MDDRKLEQLVRLSFDIEPSANLRSRVLTREPEIRSRLGWWPRLQLAATAAGIVAIALLNVGSHVQNARIEHILTNGDPAQRIQIDPAEYARRSAEVWASSDS